MNKKKNYQRTLWNMGVQNWDGRQYDTYYDILASDLVLQDLTGRQMAYVALKMAVQREHGFDECMKEFNLKIK